MVYTGDIRMKPSEIRFIQDSISPYFQDGKGQIADAITRIQRGYLSPDNFPPIKVVQRDCKIYSFDNRRLYVFRVCEVRGYVCDIPVRLCPIWQFREDCFTTTDDGRTLYVRRGITETHCLDYWLPQRDTAGNMNLPGHTAIVKNNANNLNTLDSCAVPLSSNSSTDERSHTENIIPEANVFSISYCNDGPRPSVSSVHSSNTHGGFSEDDINNNVSLLPQVPDNNRDTYRVRLPSSSHSNRVHIAANFGDGDFGNAAYFPQREPSFTSAYKSSLHDSISEQSHNSQDSHERLKSHTATVVQPHGSHTTTVQASDDTTPKDRNPGSTIRTSFLERIFAICCCCCPSKN